MSRIKKYLGPGLTLIASTMIAGYFLIPADSQLRHLFESNSHYDIPGEVHVHADFLMYIHDNRIRFTDSKYQSDEDHVHHQSIHFHDGNDEVIHRHAEGIPLVEFFASLGFGLTDTCLTLDAGTEFCNTDNDQVAVFVNNTPLKNVAEYVTSEEDQILVYYGAPDNPRLSEYQNAISNDACLYSKTCPERGTPPTESCGLTCEITNLFH